MTANVMRKYGCYLNIVFIKMTKKKKTQPRPKDSQIKSIEVRMSFKVWIILNRRCSLKVILSLQFSDRDHITERKKLTINFCCDPISMRMIYIVK